MARQISKELPPDSHSFKIRLTEPKVLRDGCRLLSREQYLSPHMSKSYKPCLSLPETIPIGQNECAAVEIAGVFFRYC